MHPFEFLLMFFYYEIRNLFFSIKFDWCFRAYELDDMEPTIAYNYALCLAKARRISEACRLIRDYEASTCLLFVCPSFHCQIKCLVIGTRPFFSNSEVTLAGSQ